MSCSAALIHPQSGAREAIEIAGLQGRNLLLRDPSAVMGIREEMSSLMAANAVHLGPLTETPESAFSAERWHC